MFRDTQNDSLFRVLKFSFYHYPLFLAAIMHNNKDIYQTQLAQLHHDCFPSHQGFVLNQEVSELHHHHLHEKEQEPDQLPHPLVDAAGS